MLTREDLEKIDWTGNEWGLFTSGGEATVDFDTPLPRKISQLLANSPRLALACLAAMDFHVLDPVGSEREAAQIDLYETLRDALAAAGVEANQ